MPRNLSANSRARFVARKNGFSVWFASTVAPCFDEISYHSCSFPGVTIFLKRPSQYVPTKLVVFQRGSESWKGVSAWAFCMSNQRPFHVGPYAIPINLIQQTIYHLSFNAIVFSAFQPFFITLPPPLGQQKSTHQHETTKNIIPPLFAERNEKPENHGWNHRFSQPVSPLNRLRGHRGTQRHRVFR